MITQHSRRAQAQKKAYFRAIIAIALIAFWSLAGLTGFLLYVAPHGPHSGWTTLLFLTKTQWGDVHFWSSVIAMVITVLHVAIDWRALKGCVQYLTSVNRSAGIRE